MHSKFSTTARRHNSWKTRELEDRHGRFSIAAARHSSRKTNVAHLPRQLEDITPGKHMSWKTQQLEHTKVGRNSKFITAAGRNSIW